jgi:hypothetical protein
VNLRHANTAAGWSRFADIFGASARAAERSEGSEAGCMGQSASMTFVVAVWVAKEAESRVKYWEIIADNLSKAGSSWGSVAAIDSNGQTIWIADAHRDDGKRFVVRADEKLTAFIELESAIRAPIT